MSGASAYSVSCPVAGSYSASIKSLSSDRADCWALLLRLCATFTRSRRCASSSFGNDCLQVFGRHALGAGVVVGFAVERA